jgi:hypothetical protein
LLFGWKFQENKFRSFAGTLTQQDTAAQSILGVGAMVDVLQEENESLKKEIDVLRNALRYADVSSARILPIVPKTPFFN